MAEVHFIGEITCSAEFQEKSLFCKWSIQAGNGWQLLSGHIQGQTSITHSNFSSNICYWNHPLDVHFITKTVQGWPRFNVQIYNVDSYGRVNLQGYGHTHLPATPGQHVLEVFVWRPSTSLTKRIVQFFIGGSVQLSAPDKALSSVHDRYRLSSESMGVVKATISVILRNFQNYGVEYK